MEASRAYGIAFRLDDATVAKYRGYGIDLEDASGESHHLLPVPSVFLIDAKGVIRWRYSNPDYRVRPDNTELLAAGREIRALAARDSQPLPPAAQRQAPAGGRPERPLLDPSPRE